MILQHFLDSNSTFKYSLFPGSLFFLLNTEPYTQSCLYQHRFLQRSMVRSTMRATKAPGDKACTTPTASSPLLVHPSSKESLQNIKVAVPEWWGSSNRASTLQKQGLRWLQFQAEIPWLCFLWCHSHPQKVVLYYSSESSAPQHSSKPTKVL